MKQRRRIFWKSTSRWSAPARGNCIWPEATGRISCRRGCSDCSRRSGATTLREASFATYARLLISRQIYSAVEASQRQKHQALNRSVPISEMEGDDAVSAIGAAESAEDIVLDLEHTRELREKIDTLLSPMERRVLALYLQGYDYLQIADRMGRPAKSIDNALQRIRGKVSRLLF